MIDVLSELVTLAGLTKGAIVIGIIAISEVAHWVLRSRAKAEYDASKKVITAFTEIEAASLAYYRKRQMLGILRAATYVAAILFAALLYDIQTFGFLALALSALVIIQKENINSLFAYVFVLSNFHVGDDIRIGEWLGEIVRVTPLQTVLSGKEENGESNGQRIVIPNYKLVSEIVTEQELKSNTYRRIVVRALYEHGTFDVEFSVFVQRVRAFLDEFLPKRNLDQVGNFRSFAGAQYKLSFEYDENGRILVRIAFISRPHDVTGRREEIIKFVEEMRSKKKPKRQKDTSREDQKASELLDQ